MSKHVLITGGAGFIGSHLTDELLRNGYRVTLLDNLADQVHGAGSGPPAYLDRRANLIIGDVRDRNTVQNALLGIDAVYHLAAAVGVGQSMYEVEHYQSTNNIGTAVLLEALIKRPVERLIVASCMSVYGEGLYRSQDGQDVVVESRRREDLERGRWEHTRGGRPLHPIPTPESKVADPSSIYALSKFDQERMCMMIGRAYDIPTVALRFSNVYGSRQALSNPYTGVLAIFASRLLNDRPPMVFEDGEQRRDFVHVHDVARACRLALESDGASHEVLNIASGHSYTVSDIAACMATTLDKPHIEPQITREYRVGDIRHCFADITRARDLLDFHPQVSLQAGILELTTWLHGQTANDRVSQAHHELSLRGPTPRRSRLGQDIARRTS